MTVGSPQAVTIPLRRDRLYESEALCLRKPSRRDPQDPEQQAAQAAPIQVRRATELERSCENSHILKCPEVDQSAIVTEIQNLGSIRGLRLSLLQQQQHLEKAGFCPELLLPRIMRLWEQGGPALCLSTI